jgi:hypothetical protein
MPRKAHSKAARRLPKLPVCFGDALDFVLLLDGVAVRAALAGVDDLVGQALSNSLDGSERCLSCTDAHEVETLVHTAERRHIHSLTTHDTTGTNAGAVFTGTSINDGTDKDLQQRIRLE